MSSNSNTITFHEIETNIKKYFISNSNQILEKANFIHFLETIKIFNLLNDDGEISKYSEGIWNLINEQNSEKTFIFLAEIEKVFHKIFMLFFSKVVSFEEDKEISSSSCGYIDLNLMKYKKVFKISVDSLIKESLSRSISCFNKRIIDKELNKEDISKLILIKKLFLVLDIQFRETILIDELKECLKYPIFDGNLEFKEAFKYMIGISLNKEIFLNNKNEIIDEYNLKEKKFLISNNELCLLVNHIENRLKEEEYYLNNDYLIDEEFKKSKKGLLNKASKTTLTNHVKSTEKANDSVKKSKKESSIKIKENNIFSSNIDLLSNILNTIKTYSSYEDLIINCFNSIMLLINNSIKSNIYKFIDSYKELDHQKDIIKLETSIGKAVNSMELKIKDYEFLFKENKKLYNFIIHKASKLKDNIKQSEESFSDLEKDFQILFLQYHQSKNDIFTDEVQRLIDENNYLNDKVKYQYEEYMENKSNLIKYEERCISLQEQITKILNEKNTLKNKINEGNNIITSLQKEKDDLYFELLELKNNSKNEFAQKEGKANEKEREKEKNRPKFDSKGFIKYIRAKSFNNPSEDDVFKLVREELKLKDSQIVNLAESNKILTEKNSLLEKRINDYMLEDNPKKSNIVANIYNRVSHLNLSQILNSEKKEEGRMELYKTPKLLKFSSIGMEISKNSTTNVNMNMNNENNNNQINENNSEEDDSVEINIKSKRSNIDDENIIEKIRYSNNENKNDEIEKIQKSNLHIKQLSIFNIVNNDNENNQEIQIDDDESKKYIDNIFTSRTKLYTERSTMKEPIILDFLTHRTENLFKIKKELYEISKYEFIILNNNKRKNEEFELSSLSICWFELTIEKSYSNRNSENEINYLKDRHKENEYEHENFIVLNSRMKFKSKVFNTIDFNTINNKNIIFQSYKNNQNTCSNNYLTTEVNRAYNKRNEGIVLSQTISDIYMKRHTTDFNIDGNNKRPYFLNLKQNINTDFFPIQNDKLALINRIGNYISYDFLSLRTNSKIQSILEKNYEEVSSYEMFSSLVYIYLKNGDESSILKYKNKISILFMTTNNIYLLNKKTLSIYYKKPIKSILKIVISLSNSNLLLIQIDNDNLFIEVTYRTYFIWYLNSIIKSKLNMNINFSLSNNFKIKEKENRYVNISPKDYSNILSVFEFSSKVSLIEIYNNGLFSWEFEERFAVLSNFGLFLFENSNCSTCNLFPILDCEIYKIEDKKFSKKWTFELRSIKSSAIFSARDAFDREDWIVKINEIKKGYKENLKFVVNYEG